MSTTKVAAAGVLAFIAFRWWSRGSKKQNSKDCPRPLVVCGPSGVGKGTLLAKLAEELPEAFAKAVSHTTRAPREGETNGVDYHFTSKEKMKQEIEEGKFVESALVHGNYYGTSVAAVDDVAKMGRICVLEIDVQGALLVSKAPLNRYPYFVFIHPPSFGELEKRLTGRGTEDAKKIAIRLETAREELGFAKEHKALFDVHMVNDDLDAAYKKLKDVFIQFYPWLK